MKAFRAFRATDYGGTKVFSAMPMKVLLLWDNNNPRECEEAENKLAQLKIEGWRIVKKEYDCKFKTYEVTLMSLEETIASKSW